MGCFQTKQARWCTCVLFLLTHNQPVGIGYRYSEAEQVPEQVWCECCILSIVSLTVVVSSILLLQIQPKSILTVQQLGDQREILNYINIYINKNTFYYESRLIF